MKTIACPLCKTRTYTVTFKASTQDNEPNVNHFLCTTNEFSQHSQIVTCTRCGHVYANPVWSKDELNKAYRTVVDEEYVREERAREMTFEKHLDFIETLGEYKDLGPLVDVGAYTGVFLEVAEKRGYKVIGIEPSDWGVAAGLKKNLKMKQGFWEDIVFEEGSLGMITMWDVIEHLLNPVQAVEKTYRELTEGGLLVIHTIDRDSGLAKIMGERWPWWMDMHINYFSQKSLEALLKRVGFDIVASGAQGRYLRNAYIVSRIEGVSATMGRVVDKIVNVTNMSDGNRYVNFGDLVTVCGVKTNVG